MRFTQNDNQGLFACDKTQCALYKDDNQQGDCSRPLLSCLRWLCLSVMAKPSGWISYRRKWLNFDASSCSCSSYKFVGKWNCPFSRLANQGLYMHSQYEIGCQHGHLTSGSNKHEHQHHSFLVQFIWSRYSLMTVAEVFCTACKKVCYFPLYFSLCNPLLPSLRSTHFHLLSSLISPPLLSFFLSSPPSGGRRYFWLGGLNDE